ncbi:aldehyde dehydrogenase family protein [Cupriavidus basilensis]
MVEILHAVADGINRRFDDFLQAEIAGHGQALSLASHVDIPRGAASFKVFADLIKNVPAESFAMATPDGGEAINYAVRSARGVIGVVCPVEPAAAADDLEGRPGAGMRQYSRGQAVRGNPATATLLGEVTNEAGVPPGVYNVVHGFGPDSAGAFLTAHPDVNGITVRSARPVPARPS